MTPGWRMPFVMSAVLFALALFGCSRQWPAPKDPLFQKLITVVSGDYQGHELLEAGKNFPIEPTVKALREEGFVENFTILPDRKYQVCGKLQVPVAGTAMPSIDDSYYLTRNGLPNVFSPEYAIALYVNKSCQVVRAVGWKVMPNSF